MVGIVPSQKFLNLGSQTTRKYMYRIRGVHEIEWKKLHY